MAISNFFARMPRYIFAILSFAMSVLCYFTQLLRPFNLL